MESFPGAVDNTAGNNFDTMKTTIECPHCKGSGEVAEEICISQYIPPAGHINEEAINSITEQAAAAFSDYEKLCKLNPRAKETYAYQLAELLEKFDDEATALL